MALVWREFQPARTGLYWTNEEAGSVNQSKSGHKWWVKTETINVETQRRLFCFELLFDMPSIDPHSYTILYQVTLMAVFLPLARMGTTSSAMRSDQRTSIGRKVIPRLDLHQLLPSNLVIVSCCIMMYHFGASLPLKTTTKCFKYLQRSLVASQKSQHFSPSDGHVLELREIE